MAEASSVQSGRSLTLTDGRELVLPHILPPGADRVLPQDERHHARKAGHALAAIVLDRPLKVIASNPAYDRYGRLRAELILKDGIDVSEEMVRRGMVRVMPEPGATPEEIGRLLGAERDARTANRGFWKGFFRAMKAAQMSDYLDRFAIVEGTVRRISEIGRRIHLEFGDDWRDDFTVGIPANRSRDFEAAGIDLLHLEGQSVRVRGWVRRWNGAFMEIDDPTQIERTDRIAPN